MTRLVNKATTGTNNWHANMLAALSNAQQEAAKYPDPDATNPDPALYGTVKELLLKVRPQVLAVVKMPNIAAGPNGEVILNWLLGNNSLDIVFLKDSVHALLKTDDATKKSCDATGTLQLIEGIAERRAANHH